MTLCMNIGEIISGIELMRKSLALMRDLVNSISKKPDKEQAENVLREAEHAFQLAEAKVAGELKYQLCKCTWPPQIMLSKGFRDYSEVFKCPRCGKEFPPPTPDFPDDSRGAP